MLKKGLSKPMTLRSAELVAGERHATWLELFYDLIFAAAISQLANQLSAEYSLAGIGRFAVLFVPIWWAWAGHTFYLSRFDSEDIVHRLMTMLQMTAVAGLTVYIPKAFDGTSVGFVLSYATVRCILVAMYIRSGRHIPTVRPLTHRYVIGFGSAAMLLALSTFIPPPGRFWLWGIAMTVDFMTPLSAGSLHLRFPPHLSHLPERFGLFTIIVIGESVVSVVAGVNKAGEITSLSALEGCMGLLISFALWWGYFDGAKGAMARTLEAQEHLKSYQIWIYSHLPLLMGITAVAVGIRHIMLLQQAEPLTAIEGWLLCGSVGLTVLSLSAIFLASIDDGDRHVGQRLVRPYYLIAFLGLATGALGRKVPGVVLLGILTMLCIAQIIVSLRVLADEEDISSH